MLFPILVNIVLERTMTHWKTTREQSALLAEQSQTYALPTTYNVDILVGSETRDKQPSLANRQTSKAFGMHVSAEKNKLITNNTKVISTYIRFKYLGASVTNAGFKPELLARVAHTTAVYAQLRNVWWDRNTAFISKIRLMRPSCP